jgi:hypothetical protein
LTELLVSPDNADAQDQLNQIKGQMAQLEQGESLVAQIDIAWNVFVK